MKKIFIFLLLFKTLSLCALVCPTIEEIKHSRVGNWQALNTDDDSPISKEQAVAYFTQHGTQFWLAQWVSDLSRSAQCYYCIDQGCGYANIYWSNISASPPTNSTWRKLFAGYFQCLNSNITECSFN